MLLDSPGVLDREIPHKLAALVGSKNPEELRSAEPLAVEIIKYMREKNSKAIKQKYGFTQFGEDDDETLEIIAKAKKRLKKGGEADTETMARQIITDWQRGKLKP